MSLKQSIHFEPGVTAMSAVIAAVHAAYGAAGLTINDNPATGTDDNDAGQGGTFDPASLDANGLPWDERIHSGGKTRTSKNVWTKKKGVSETDFNAIAGQLRSASPAPAASPAPTPQPLGQVQQQPAAAVGLQIGAGLQPLGQVQHQPTPFESLIHFIADQQSKRPDFSATYVADSLKSWGIVDQQGNGSTAALQNLSADQIAQVRATFAQVLGLPAGS